MNGGTFYAGTDMGLFEFERFWMDFFEPGFSIERCSVLYGNWEQNFCRRDRMVYVPNRDPRFPGYYYLTSSGIFSSNDNGKSWVEILDYLEYGDSNWYVSIASSGNTLFAGNTYSTDFGLTWNNDSIAPNFNSISGTNVFGEYDGNVFFSSNSGVGWRRITSDSSYNYTGAGASNENTLFIARSDDSILVLGTDGTSHVEFNTGLGYNTTIGSLQWQTGIFMLTPAALFGVARSPISALVPSREIAARRFQQLAQRIPQSRNEHAANYGHSTRRSSSLRQPGTQRYPNKGILVGIVQADIHLEVRLRVGPIGHGVKAIVRLVREPHPDARNAGT